MLTKSVLSVCFVSLIAVVGCGGGSPATSGAAGSAGGSSGSAGSTGTAGTGEAGTGEAGTGAAGTGAAGTGTGAAGTGAAGTGAAGTGAAGAGAESPPPVPPTVSGHVSVVVRDQGKDTAWDCMGGTGAAAPTYQMGGPVTYLSLTCISSTTDHARLFRLTVTAMGVPLGMGTHHLMSLTAAPVPTLAVSVVDVGEGFSAPNFNGDGGVSFDGELKLDAVGAAKGDTVSGSFVASWTHVPIVTGGQANKVGERHGSVAVSFSFPRS